MLGDQKINLTPTSLEHYEELEAIWQRYTDGRIRLFLGPYDDGTTYRLYTKYPLPTLIRQRIRADALELGLNVAVTSEPYFREPVSDRTT